MTNKAMKRQANMHYLVHKLLPKSIPKDVEVNNKMD